VITEAIVVGAIQARRRRLGLPPLKPFRVHDQSAGTLALLNASSSDPRLPSGDAALHLFSGEPGAFVEVAKTVALRSVFASLGLAIAGFTGRKLVLATLGSVLGVEVGVLAWAWLVTRKAKAA
jgi:hypothetical protein